MTTKYYDLENISLEERQKIFETDPNNYIYSVFHNIVDKAQEISIFYEKEEGVPFVDTFPFEVITQTFNFLIGVYGTEIIFERIDFIKEAYKNDNKFNIQ